MKKPEYIQTLASGVKNGYSIGYESCAESIELFIAKTYSKEPSKRKLFQAIFDSAMDQYYDVCGSGNDANLRVLPKDRDKIDEVIRNAEHD